MKIVKVFIFLFLIIQNGLYAQSIIGARAKQPGKCPVLSEEEINEMGAKLKNIIRDIEAEKLKKHGLLQDINNTPQTRTVNNHYWQATIFTNNPKISKLLSNKYTDYDKVLYGDNWKNSPYGNLTSEEINNKVNSLLNDTYKNLKQNPFYKSERFSDYCNNTGIILIDMAAFVVLSEYAAAALPAVETVAGYSFLSGFAWNFSTLFGAPNFLQATSTLGRLGSTALGTGSSIYVLDKFHDFIKDIFNISDSKTLATQRDLITALDIKFDLVAQIKEIENNTSLTKVQKQKRIETRYKEAIIKIYALDYVNTYLTYAEKPEKYFWAVLDLTNLLQNNNSVNFGNNSYSEMEIGPLPRLTERTPQLKEDLHNLTSVYINGFNKVISDYATKKIEQQAMKNLKNANFDF